MATQVEISFQNHSSEMRQGSPSKGSHETKGENNINLEKIASLVEQLRKIVTSPVQKEKDIHKTLPALSRQVKLYLTVDAHLVEAVSESNSLEVLISVLKKTIHWSNVIFDLLIAVNITYQCIANKYDSLKHPDKYGEMLCRHAIPEVCLLVLKRYDNTTPKVRVSCLELLVYATTFATSQKDVKRQVPNGRDLVFDGSALVLQTVHALVKNGALVLLPSILLLHYTSLAERGSDCILSLLLFIIESVSLVNAIELLKGINKDFVSASVMHLYRAGKAVEEMGPQSCGLGTSEVDDSAAIGNADLTVLMAGLIYCNEEIAIALARDSRKWHVIREKIAGSFPVFEGSTVRTAWYRGCFDKVSEAQRNINFDDLSNVSAKTPKTRSSHSRQSYSVKSSKDSHSKMSPKSNLNEENRVGSSPMLIRASSSIVSFDEQLQEAEELVAKNRLERDRECASRKGARASSVQYALDLIAAKNDPLHIDTDVTTTSMVLYRLKTGPYSGSTIESKSDLAGAYSPKRSPSNKNKSLKDMPTESTIDNELPLVETNSLSDEIFAATEEIPGEQSPDVDITAEEFDDFIYEDTAVEPHALDEPLEMTALVDSSQVLVLDTLTPRVEEEIHLISELMEPHLDQKNLLKADSAAFGEKTQVTDAETISRTDENLPEPDECAPMTVEESSIETVVTDSNADVVNRKNAESTSQLILDEPQGVPLEAQTSPSESDPPAAVAAESQGCCSIM